MGLRQAAAVLVVLVLAATGTQAHRGSNIDHFRVASKTVTRYSVQGYFKVSHRVNRHSNDGNEFTTETWCDIWVRAQLLRRGRSVDRDAFVAYGAPGNKVTSLSYYLDRKGWNLPARRRAKRLVVSHVHVDLASCEAF